MKVQVKHLRKEFGKTVAVDNISFAFDSGHVFGFVGPNGAGKTTTMRIIATIEEPTDGDVSAQRHFRLAKSRNWRAGGRLRAGHTARARGHHGA